MTVHPITPAQPARLTSDPAFWSDDATAAELRAALAAFRYVQRCAGPKLDQPEADSMERGLRIVRDVILTLTPLTTEEG